MLWIVISKIMIRIQHMEQSSDKVLLSLDLNKRKKSSPPYNHPRPPFSQRKTLYINQVQNRTTIDAAIPRIASVEMDDPAVGSLLSSSSEFFNTNEDRDVDFMKTDVGKSLHSEPILLRASSDKRGLRFVGGEIRKESIGDNPHKPSDTTAANRENR